MHKLTKPQIARMKKIMTQEELAKKAGITRQTVWAFESGKHTPQLITIQKIADALECTVLDLI